MTRLSQIKLQKQILEIVQNETVSNLHFRIDCCCCELGGDNEYIGFYLSQIAPYIYKKLGYRVRLDTIKHALAPLKKDNYFFKSS